MSKEVEIIRMSSIQWQEVDWLRLPHTSYNKAMIQGDPDEGKTMLVHCQQRNLNYLQS